jgi:tetratricopeptide (TPR) repeat protein
VVKASVKRPKDPYRFLEDIYNSTLDELGRRGDIISQAVYTSEVMRSTGNGPGVRITAGLLKSLFDKAKEAEGERLLAIRAVVVSCLCENGARGLAEGISKDPAGPGLDDGFWFLAATGLLEEGRWKEAEEVIPRCVSPESRAMIWQALVKHHAGRDDLEKAGRAVESAAGEIRTHSDAQAMALKLCRLARRCAHLGIRDKGLELMGEVERIQVDGWPLDQITALLVSRSRSMLALWKQGEALRLAEEALRYIEGSMQEEIEDSKGRKARRIVDRERDLARLGALFVRLGCDQRSQRCLELIGSKHYRQKFFIAYARACIRAGRLEKAIEFMEQISSPSVKLGLRLEMARFYHRHGLLGDEAKMLSEAEEEEKKLNIEIKKSKEHDLKLLRDQKKSSYVTVADIIDKCPLELLQRLWAIKSLAKKF